MRCRAAHPRRWSTRRHDRSGALRRSPRARPLPFHDFRRGECTDRPARLRARQYRPASRHRRRSDEHRASSRAAAPAPRAACARPGTPARRRPRDPSRAPLAPFENVEDLAQLALDRRDGLQLQGGSRDTADLSLATVLVDLLARALDRVLLGIEQMLDELDELDLTPLVHPVAGSILRRTEELELAFPVSQHVRLELGELAHLANRIELLHRLLGRGPRGHHSGSARSSRVLGSPMAGRGSLPSRGIRSPAATMGISISSRDASACALSVVYTPSATVSRAASDSSRRFPWPISIPSCRLRLKAPVQVSTRSPIPANPANVDGSA